MRVSCLFVFFTLVSFFFWHYNWQRVSGFILLWAFKPKLKNQFTVGTSQLRSREQTTHSSSRVSGLWSHWLNRYVTEYSITWWSIYIYIYRSETVSVVLVVLHTETQLPPPNKRHLRQNKTCSTLMGDTRTGVLHLLTPALTSLLVYTQRWFVLQDQKTTFYKASIRTFWMYNVRFRLNSLTLSLLQVFSETTDYLWKILDLVSQHWLACATISMHILN